MSVDFVNLSMTRRKLIKGTACSAAAASAPSLVNHAFAEQIAKLEKEGWSKHPVACTMCGAYCGILAMRKEGEPISEKTVRIFPNPGHPQQGYCGRSASAMWIWNHPLRLRKPLKRIGEKGEGKFKEITWDEALNEIGAKVKDLVQKYGESCITTTSHNFQGMSKWLTFPLGSPNNIGHQSSCNAAGINARNWVFGTGFSGAGKLEPDYENLRYLLLIGRTMGASMGALHTLNVARAKGARVVAIDPKMPDITYGDAEWVAIRPGTDDAFLSALINEMLRTNTADLDFIEKGTNGAYLIKENGQPLTQAEVIQGGDKTKYVVASPDGRLSFRGVLRNDKGIPTAFDEDSSFKADLNMSGSVKLADGSSCPVKTAFVIIKETLAPYTPEKSSEITGIPADMIRRIARDFTNLKGVIDDGWYTSKNGTDVQVYRLVSIANAFNGNIDIPGGMIVTAAAGLKIPSVSQGKGPNGETWRMAKEKRIDKIIYPEAEGTFKVAMEAVLTGKPYPIKAAFFVGTTMFQREANSEELAERLKKLELSVVQDVLPQEICDYADYVLPSTYFMERMEMSGVKWARDGSIYLSDPQLSPPEGCEARHDVWILLEILRRAFPERAARVGYKECKTAEEFNAYFDAFTKRGYAQLLEECDKVKPGWSRRIHEDIRTKGWSTIKIKEYGVYPYKKPFGTPSGKVEIYSFKSFEKPAYVRGIPPFTAHIPAPAFTPPKRNSNEFILVSGKNCTSCSGLSMFALPSKYLGDRTVWMNPEDAERLGISHGETVEVEGIDTAYKGNAQITVTKKVISGSLFAFGFSGGNRIKHLADHPDYQFIKEGINSHWYAKGYAQPVFGTVANNSAVRINKLRG